MQLGAKLCPWISVADGLRVTITRRLFSWSVCGWSMHTGMLAYSYNLIGHILNHITQAIYSLRNEIHLS